MSISPRRSQVRIAYPSDFATQSDFVTALAAGDIDAVFSLSDEEPKLEFLIKKDEILDCTGQYLLEKIVQSRSCRLTFGIEVEASKLFGLLGLALGTLSGGDALMLSPTEFQPAPTSLIYGHAGGNQDPLLLKSMVLAKIVITEVLLTKVKASLEFRGHGNPAVAAGYEFPDCSPIVPVYMKDGTFILNSVEELANVRSIEFTYDNRPLADEDPFTMASVDITRMERDDRREHDFKFTIYGEENDAKEQASRSDPVTHYPLSHRIGSATDGVTLVVTDGILEQNGGIKHDGQARRSVIDLMILPTRVSGDADTPVKATRNT